MLQRHLETKDNAGMCVPWPYDYHNLSRIVQHSFVPRLQNEFRTLSFYYYSSFVGLSSVTVLSKNQ